MAHADEGVSRHCVKAAHLLTRNPQDFPKASLSILTPDEFLAVWREHHASDANDG